MSILLLIILIILFLINVPVAIAIGLSTVIVAVIGSDVPLIRLPQTLFSSLNSFPLLAAPFFILAGKLMQHGGISEKLINFANSMVGSLRGGLAYVTIITCMFFAAISGSAIATMVAIGSIMVPAMVKKGFDRNFSSVLQAAGGAIGAIIPPSIPLVLYGVAAGVSIGDLFLAGIIPGVLVGGSLIFISFLYARKNDLRQVETDLESQNPGLWVSFKEAFWALLMPVIILGGIYGGIFTPTEASAIAVVYGFIVGKFVYKQITFGTMKKIFLSTVLTTSALGLIIATASFFGMWLTIERVPHEIATAISEANLSPLVTVILINVFLLFLGTFMDASAALIISTPILLPIVTSIGMDPIHFGIMMVVNLGIGLLTPPLGVGLFIASKVGDVKYEKLIKPALPFIIILIVDVILIALFPQISVGLTNVFD
ncbi:TRAP transporter large permease [Alteribacillus sp. YIM 98480]|uniref:TRAP transporter large permease n=1 Tax=Alteribacillus sp. YIM 98480 TaxID=2606599 RepID=UPI00131D5008|nr:TRAP transporter large permease [Alteribacillus sp. YIM 98480]